jgi:ArsR family transcriptional regulator
MKDCVDAFKAVGESTRFRALRLLIEAKTDLCACEIIDVLQKPQYTISKCLGGLVDASLVDERREGRKMMYSLARGPMNDAIFEAVARAERDEECEEDIQRLTARLALRVNEVCTVGC